jgi:hypothetical protein
MKIAIRARRPSEQSLLSAIDFRSLIQDFAQVLEEKTLKLTHAPYSIQSPIVPHFYLLPLGLLLDLLHPFFACERKRLIWNQSLR